MYWNRSEQTVSVLTIGSVQNLLASCFLLLLLVANSFFVSFFLSPSFFSLSFPMNINHSTNWLWEKNTQHYTTKPLTSCVLLCKLTSSSSKNHQTKLLGTILLLLFFFDLFAVVFLVTIEFNSDFFDL